MRSIFYTEAQIDEAFHHWGPKLRSYAAECRQLRPLPDRDSLSPAEREQLRIISSALARFRDSPIFIRDGFVEIVHGSSITLLAAQDVFGASAESIVPLLSEENSEWFSEVFQGADGWFGKTWVTVHDPVPRCLAADVANFFPQPIGFSYWILSYARAGSATHELWKWDGESASLVGVAAQECWEEGFIDSLDHWPVS